MNATQVLKTTAGYLWRIPLCASAYVVGAMGGGALVAALGMPLPEIPEQANEQIMGQLLFVASLALAVGLAPLSRRIQGAYWQRWLMLAALCYVCLGVTTPLEAAIFTTLGGMASIPVVTALPCLLFAAVMALLFKPAERGDTFLVNARRFFQDRGTREWTWRFGAAICAFPVIYWTFGMMVAPFVIEYYKQGQFGLTAPNAGVIVLAQLARSSLFLAGTLPILMMWTGSRRQLIAALGVAFYVLVGLFGMIQGYWLAPILQVLHNSELFADSVVYALALSLLLVRTKTRETDDSRLGLPTWAGRVQPGVVN